MNRERNVERRIIKINPDGTEAPPLPAICEQVRYYRKKNGMEQKELAQMLGITRSAVTNWEKGRARPDIDLIPRLCEILKITPYELLQMEDQNPYTKDEQTLINNYRKLTEAHQKFMVRAICDLVETEKEYSTEMVEDNKKAGDSEAFQDNPCSEMSEEYHETIIETESKEDN